MAKKPIHFDNETVAAFETLNNLAVMARTTTDLTDKIIEVIEERVVISVSHVTRDNWIRRGHTLQSAAELVGYELGRANSLRMLWHEVSEGVTTPNKQQRGQLMLENAFIHTEALATKTANALTEASVIAMQINSKLQKRAGNLIIDLGRLLGRHHLH